MTDNEITHEIIGAAIEVHKLLGPGLLESAYEACLRHEFAIRKIGFQKQKPVPLVYKEIKFDCGFRLDLLVEKRVVVELKSVDALAPIHEAIMLTYLRLSGHTLGLLINFNVSILKDGIRRFIM
jgi:GxxExxY protein